MNKWVGKICPYCNTSFRETDDIVICDLCEMPHHRECWMENGSCTTFGCTGHMIQVHTAISGNNFFHGESCSECGSPLDMGAAFCTICGARVGVKSVPMPESRNNMQCPNCHNAVPMNSKACTYCGYRFDGLRERCTNCGGALDSAGNCSICGYRSMPAPPQTSAPKRSESLSHGAANENQCSSCGFTLEPGAGFCVNCGKKVESASSGGGRIRSTVDSSNRRELTQEEKQAVKKNFKRAGAL